VARTPLILREVGFSFLLDSADRSFAKGICQESPQAGRFSILAIGYLFRAAKLPPEFLEKVEKALMALLEK
jgi:hypothetical protein